MSSSTTMKAKPVLKEKLSVMKLTKANLLNNDMLALKTSLSDVIEGYEAKIRVIYLDSRFKLFRDDEKIRSPVIVLTAESAQRPLVRSITWKHFHLTKESLSIFLSFCEKYAPTLSSLRLEEAHLKEDEITILSQFLTSNQNVIEINLTGNPYQQNFCSLIQDNNVKYLTLKFCGIRGADLISLLNPLRIPHKHPLIHLNLSNNNIGADGSKAIADFLRINRTLTSLNISCNKITDVGAKVILETLQKFQLNNEEVSVRRKIHYRYYTKKFQEIKLTAQHIHKSLDRQEDEQASLASKSKLRKYSKMKSKSRSISKSATSLAESSSKSLSKSRDVLSAPPYSAISLPSNLNVTDIVTTLDYLSAYHPFIGDTIAEDSQFYCKGNLTLEYLNISFNNLTTNSLTLVHEVLIYQSSNGTTDEGLRAINFCGNNLKSENLEQLQQDITDLFALKTTRPSSIGNSWAKDAPRRERRRSKN